MKKTFVLRIEASVYSSVEKWAEDEFRSVNGQLEWMIREQLRKSGRLKKMTESPDDQITHEKKDIKQ